MIGVAFTKETAQEYLAAMRRGRDDPGYEALVHCDPARERRDIAVALDGQGLRRISDETAARAFLGDPSLRHS